MNRYQAFWEQLPEAERSDGQIAGVTAVGCGATHSIMERCNFSCTSCYLSEGANATVPAPFAEVQAQLDELRAYLGPEGKCQITSGEVTLLPVQELGRIVVYALQIGLDAMLMTNGERFLQQADYLRTLVEEFGLQKVSFHVDSTQRGRPDSRQDQQEEELHELRDRFADLVRQTRTQTGKVLHAAMTVTDANAAGVPGVIDWALNHADAIRLVSFLPVAPVGRTRDEGADGLDLDGVWQLICRGAGQALNRDALRFGHRECNITVPVIVAHAGRQRSIIEIVRAENGWDRRIMRRALREFAPGIHIDDGLPMAVLRLAAAVTGKRFSLRPQLLVAHRFMSAAEIDTDIGRQRLAACVFRVPVDGKMVSMCEVIAGDLRQQLTKRQRRPDRRQPVPV
jgi:MoaA/NifB/PqqE/SkfB family radical SAM enzyme